MIAAGSGWNDASLKGAFYRGLNEPIKDELAAREEAESVNALISLAIKLDSMQLGRARLTQAEHQRRMTNKVFVLLDEVISLLLARLSQKD